MTLSFTCLVAFSYVHDKSVVSVIEDFFISSSEEDYAGIFVDAVDDEAAFCEATKDSDP